MQRLSALKCLAFSAALAGMTATANATVYSFSAVLDGLSENPPNASPGTGFANVAIDDVAHTISIAVSFSGLIGVTTVAHIHCCVAPPGNVGVAVTPGTLVGFPAGVTSGSYFNAFDTTDSATYTASFITTYAGGLLANAEGALIAGLLAGQAYLNIHTTFAPGGEIRGFLAETPLPGALPLFVSGMGVLGLLGLRRRRRVSAA